MTITVCSPSFDPCDSYGRLANELCHWLGVFGHAINRIGDDAPDVPLSPILGGLLLGYPTLHHTYGNMVNAGPKIAITMFESTVLPDGWAEALNQCDAVIIPSHFLMEVFRKSGVTAPLHVVPLGISPAFREVRQRPPAHPFTFLAIADRGRRKGWDKAVFAFDRAFGDDPDVRLILKARKFPLRFTNANIDLIDADYSDEQMAELYGRCHAMVFPTCGEGFGLPPREFAATGGLALATDWGGTADDLRQWGIPIPVKNLAAAWPDRSDWAGTLGQWADVDTAVLADLMMMTVTKYRLWQTVQADKAAQFVEQTYRWSDFAYRIEQLWKSALEARYGDHANRYGDQSVTAAARAG